MPNAPKIARLKRRGGKRREDRATLSCYGYQKTELQRRARAKRMSVSYYLNFLLWSQWC